MRWGTDEEWLSIVLHALGSEAQIRVIVIVLAPPAACIICFFSFFLSFFSLFVCRCCLGTSNSPQAGRMARWKQLDEAAGRRRRATDGEPAAFGRGGDHGHGRTDGR